jgi:MFS family permease
VAGTPERLQMASESTAGDAPVEYAHTRWNFVVMVLDASAFIAGLAFASPLIVLPLFMERLTGSTVLVGVMSAIQMSGWFLPQLPIASLVEHRARKKPFMLKVCLVGRTPMVLIPLSLLLLAGRPTAMLALFLILNAVFFLSDGMTGVPWTDIGAKSIPPRMRGRFFGSMQLLGGFLSVLAGLAVRKILDHPSLPYPKDYAVLFGIEFILLMVSWVFLALIREPVRPVRGDSRSVGQLLRAAPGLLRAHPDLIRLIVVMGFMGMSAVAVPFYAIYANTRLGIPEAMAGVFISAQMAGGIASSMLWAYLSDRRGSTRVIRGTALCNLATPLFAWLAPSALAHLGPAAVGYGYAVTFFLIGMALNGAWIGPTNFVLEIVGEKERPAYVALMNTMGAPLVLLPILGGWVVRVTSYETVLVIAAACTAISVVATAWLREPRETQAAESPASTT